MKKSLFYVKNRKIYKSFKEHISFVLGAAVYAFAFDFFIEPNEISTGGVTGLAAVVNYIFNLPTGTVLFVLNIPILIFGFFKLGGNFILKTFLVTIYTSVFIDVFSVFLPVFKGERLLAAVFGGVLLGLGLAMVMLNGATTGGIDVIAKILKGKFPFMSMGRLIFILDGVVVLVATICYRNIETALFTVILLFVSSKIMDAVLYGGEESRLLFIITCKGKYISSEFYKILGRGVTFVPVLGGFNRTKSEMVICAMRKNEVGRAINLIKNCDPNAFTVVTLSGGVFGYGFEKLY